jgi:hypothetical protein
MTTSTYNNNTTSGSAARQQSQPLLPLHDTYHEKKDHEEEDDEEYFGCSATTNNDMSLTTPLLLVNDNHGDHDRRTTSEDHKCADGALDDPNNGDNRSNVTISFDTFHSVAIAAIFLTDYEHSRPCSLPTKIAQIQSIHVKIHRIRYSFLWQCILYTAVGCLFLSSCLEGGQSGWTRISTVIVVVGGGGDGHEDWIQFVLTLLAALVLSVDVIMTTSIVSSPPCERDDDGGGGGDDDDNDDEYHSEEEPSLLEEMEGVDDEIEMFPPQSHHTHTHRRPRQRQQTHTHTHTHYNPRGTNNRARHWKLPLVWMLLGVTLETWMKLIVYKKKFVWTGCFKPIVFFYASSKARDGEKNILCLSCYFLYVIPFFPWFTEKCLVLLFFFLLFLLAFSALTALYHVSRIVFRVIFIELFLLLSFASMACHLYFRFDSYRDLPTSFLSLFEIQTTAATPGLWISVYEKDRSSAIFFVLFLIICVFFVHSIGE